MSNQQINAGPWMSDEQVDKQSATQEDTPTTEQQAPVDRTTSPTTQDHPSPGDSHVPEVPLDELRDNYTLMVEQYSKRNVKEGQELAHMLGLSGAYPESDHARLFLAQGTQDPYMHARKAVSEAISGAAKYEWKDPEAKKLLDLTKRTLNQVRPSEDSLATIEEVDEEDIQASEGAQEAKKEELKRKMAEWTAQLNAAALKARSGKR